MNRLSLPLFIVCCLFVEPDSVVAEPPATMTSVRFGFGNHYKNGLWTPITLEWNSPIPDGYAITIRASDADGTPITYHYTVKEEHTRNGTSTTLLVKLGRKDEPIEIAGLTDFFQTFSVPPPVNAERPIYLIIGNDDIGLQGAVAELMFREERRPLLVKLNSLSDLPDKWFGYESVEMIVLTTTEPKLFEGLTTESPQVQAISDWVKLGGKMLLCVGKDAVPFLEPENGFLRLFFPGQFAGMTEMRSGTTLERFVNSQRQIFMNGTDESPFMRVPRMTEPQGLVFVQDGDLPLVLRAAHGLGTVIYFGGDLSERPLINWRDRVALVRNIMQWNTERRGAVDPRAGAMLQLGYNDISGQIRSALDQFEGVSIIPFSVILIILTAYWLVIGLFDWFLVQKVLRRPILTWATFPLWIMVFCVLTYTLAASGRPTSEKMNTLFLWDVDYETNVMRESTWMSHYSPTDQRHPGTVNSGDGYSSWYGLPGSGLGGMAPKTVSPPVWQVGAEQMTYDRITSVPVQTRSTKSFFSQQYTRSPLARTPIDAKLSDEEGVPVGTIEVRPEGDCPDFPFILQDCILVYGRWVLELGKLQSGQTIRLTRTTFTSTVPAGTTSSAVPRRDLRDLLIPPKTLEDARLLGMATYNPQSTDLEYIVRVMSLHRALGGYESTGLHNAFQPSLDMSELLTADRALLLGVMVMPEAENTSQLRHQTRILRQSFPITLTSSSPRLRGAHSDALSGDALDVPIRTEHQSDPSMERR